MRSTLLTFPLLLLAAFSALPAEANTTSCTFLAHDTDSVNACAYDAQQGDTQACPGRFASTGAHANVQDHAFASIGFYDLDCADGTSSQGMFLQVFTYGDAPEHAAGAYWQDGDYNSGGNEYCFTVVETSRGEYQSFPCPFPLPNPGWGHLIP